MNETKKFKAPVTVGDKLGVIKEVQIADQLRYLKLKERVDAIEKLTDDKEFFNKTILR